MSFEVTPNYIFKTFLIGKEGVGKLTFVKSPNFSTFPDEKGLTTGIFYGSYDYPFDSSDNTKYIKYSIWVYNPEKRFKFLFPSFLLGSNAIAIMFDVSDLTSLNEIDQWMEIIRIRCINTPIMLLGNKADLTEHFESAKTLADSIVEKYRLLGYLEISALESRNIEIIFETFTKTLLQRLNPNYKRKN